jgi:hypothetical protein
VSVGKQAKVVGKTNEKKTKDKKRVLGFGNRIKGIMENSENIKNDNSMFRHSIIPIFQKLKP